MITINDFWKVIIEDWHIVVYQHPLKGGEELYNGNLWKLQEQMKKLLNTKMYW